MIKLTFVDSFKLLTFRWIHLSFGMLIWFCLWMCLCANDLWPILTSYLTLFIFEQTIDYVSFVLTIIISWIMTFICHFLFLFVLWITSGNNCSLHLCNKEDVKIRIDLVITGNSDYQFSDSPNKTRKCPNFERWNIIDVWTAFEIIHEFANGSFEIAPNAKII